MTQVCQSEFVSEIKTAERKQRTYISVQTTGHEGDINLGLAWRMENEKDTGESRTDTRERKAGIGDNG